ncbi:hypothetical protein B0H14DRAFT_3523817 [Mycena olivaceomarginata]|nr:hypothetical protein B0H14DRAFT_3523817 [Mycena olivaceomarginata]
MSCRASTMKVEELEPTARESVVSFADQEEGTGSEKAPSESESTHHRAESVWGENAAGADASDFLSTVVPHTNYQPDSSVAAAVGSRPSSAASETPKAGAFNIYPQALVLGDLESAVSLCLASARYADAILLAHATLLHPLPATIDYRSPIAIVHWMGFTHPDPHHGMPSAATFVVISLYGLSGAVNVVLLLFTRPNSPLFGKDECVTMQGGGGLGQGPELPPVEDGERGSVEYSEFRVRVRAASGGKCECKSGRYLEERGIAVSWSWGGCRRAGTGAGGICCARVQRPQPILLPLPLLPRRMLRENRPAMKAGSPHRQDAAPNFAVLVVLAYLDENVPNLPSLHPSHLNYYDADPGSSPAATTPTSGTRAALSSICEPFTNLLACTRLQFLRFTPFPHQAI